MAESQKASEIRERARAWRDIMLQMTATIMIPLTIAAMGLYYTRWQQNVNDLKTMIDLVSDDKPERQKYGIAMFEYLLKNDKVPVEFVAAQLDYANNATDPQLLPAMERALNETSRRREKPGSCRVNRPSSSADARRDEPSRSSRNRAASCIAADTACRVDSEAVVRPLSSSSSTARARPSRALASFGRSASGGSMAVRRPLRRGRRRCRGSGPLPASGRRRRG